MPHSIRPKAALAVALAAIAVFAATVAPATASAALKLGVFNSGAPADADAVADHTALIGQEPDIVMWYHDFGHDLLTSEEVATLRATGQAPMVTWEPFKQSLSAIAAGDHDSYLRESARQAKDFGDEVMVRFAHEMNGSWYPWSRSSDYVGAWRHIVSVFRAEGADNVRWVWAPNVDSGGSMPFAQYFPGDEWVDYVGLDGYNWGGQRWSSLEKVFATSYDQITQLSAKPVMITETSSSENGGDKAEWIRTGFLETIPQRFPRISAVIWFNKVQEDDWPIASSDAALVAYREVAACSLYGGPDPCGSSDGVADPIAEESPEGVAIRAVHVTRRVTTPRAPRVEARHARKARKARKARQRGTVSYRLSRRARKVRIRIQHRKRRGFVARAVVTRRGHSGRNRVALKQLLRRRKLRRGWYRVVIVASDGRGNRSHPRRAHFRVIR